MRWTIVIAAFATARASVVRPAELAGRNGGLAADGAHVQTSSNIDNQEAVATWSTLEDDAATHSESLHRRYTITSMQAPIDKTNATENCSLFSKYNSTCWDVLNITGFLRDWKETIRNCNDPSRPNPDQCYNSTKTWSTNFLFLMANGTDFNCEEITGTTCQLIGVNPRRDLSEAPKIRFVLWAIKSANALYSTWWSSMQFAMANAGQTGPRMTQLLDKVNSNHAKFDLIMAITMVGISSVAETGLVKVAAGLSAAQKAEKQSPSDMYIPSRPDLSPKGRPEAPWGRQPDVPVSGTRQKTADTINGVTLRAMIFSPFLARILWPSETDDSRLVQIGQLSHVLDQVRDGVQQRLLAANKAMMTDFDCFVNATQNGTFTNAELPSISNVTSNLLFALKTWLLTTSLRQNGFQGWSGPAISDGLLTTLDSAALNFGCIPSNATGICTVDEKGRQGQRQKWSTYPSNLTGNFYTFTKFDRNYLIDEGAPTAADVINEALSSNWTTLELLFDASYLCKQRQRTVGTLPGSDSNNSTAANSSESSVVPANAPIAISRRDANQEVDNVGMVNGLDFVCVGQLDISDGCGSSKVGAATRWGIAKTAPNQCSNFFAM